jgi:hypothetical protein
LRPRSSPLPCTRAPDARGCAARQPQPCAVMVSEPLRLAASCAATMRSVSDAPARKAAPIALSPLPGLEASRQTPSPFASFVRRLSSRRGDLPVPCVVRVWARRECIAVAPPPGRPDVHRIAQGAFEETLLDRGDTFGLCLVPLSLRFRALPASDVAEIDLLAHLATLDARGRSVKNFARIVAFRCSRASVQRRLTRP